MSMRSATALVLIAGCSGAVATQPGAFEKDAGVREPPAGQPSGWDQDLGLRRALDLDPDPRVLEVNLEARVAEVSIHPGTTTEAWTYDGGLPGPLLRLNVGDKLIVHFTNRLPEPTSIHWHGLRIPVEMDGVPDHPVPPIAPGGSYRYEFVVPDAGLFWYHPHFHSARQLGDGLYGAILVEDPGEPAGLGDELVMVLSDIDVGADGKWRPHDAGGDVATLFGREGDTVLVNGKLMPALGARVGVRQRWRIVNAARTRYFQLAAQGQKFLRIGGDGGRLSRPVEVERPVLIPGERADLIWEPAGEPGQEIPLRWVPYDRGWGSTYNRPEVEVARIRLSSDPPRAQAALPELARPLVAYDLAGARDVTIRLTRNDQNGKFALGINGRPFGGDDHLMARIGETQLWTIVNDMDWAHPFHIHGFFYQVLDGAGRPREPLEWKDTADVPAKGSLRVAVRFDDRPGMWMFHCHILDHADAGMMGMLMVER
jgi:FtsP/CotA-like multicopper oxidase with cupredoxin domain